MFVIMCLCYIYKKKKFFLKIYLYVLNGFFFRYRIKVVGFFKIFLNCTSIGVFGVTWVWILGFVDIDVYVYWLSFGNK